MLDSLLICLLDINDSHNTSETSVNIPIQHSSTQLTAKSKEKNKDAQHSDQNILSIQPAHLVKKSHWLENTWGKFWVTKMLSKILI